MAKEMARSARPSSRHRCEQRLGLAHSAAVAHRGRNGVLLLESRLECGTIPATRGLPGTRRRCRSVPLGDHCGQRPGEARRTDWTRRTTWPNEVSSYPNPSKICPSHEPIHHTRIQGAEPAGRTVLADDWRYEPNRSAGYC